MRSTSFHQPFWSDLVELGIDGPKISHIPNGIKIGDPIRKSHVASIRRLVWVGRLTAQKGIDILFKALANVVAAGREFSLEIIGNGPDMALLLEQRRQLLSRKESPLYGGLGQRRDPH